MANKRVNYIELLTMIKNKKIDEGTKIKRYEGNDYCGDYILQNMHLVLYGNDSESVLENINSYTELFNSSFEILLESKERDIDSINKLNNFINKKDGILEFGEIKAIVELLLEINNKLEKMKE